MYVICCGEFNEKPNVNNIQQIFCAPCKNCLDIVCNENIDVCIDYRLAHGKIANKEELNKYKADIVFECDTLEEGSLKDFLQFYDFKRNTLICTGDENIKDILGHSIGFHFGYHFPGRMYPASIETIKCLSSIHSTVFCLVYNCIPAIHYITHYISLKEQVLYRVNQLKKCFTIIRQKVFNGWSNEKCIQNRA